MKLFRFLGTPVLSARELGMNLIELRHCSVSGKFTLPDLLETMTDTGLLLVRLELS